MWVQMHSGCEYSLGLCSCWCACICEGQIIQRWKNPAAPVDCRLHLVLLQISIDEHYSHKMHTDKTKPFGSRCTSCNIAKHLIMFCVHGQTSQMVSSHILVFLKLWILNCLNCYRRKHQGERPTALYVGKLLWNIATFICNCLRWTIHT